LRESVADTLNEATQSALELQLRRGQTTALRSTSGTDNTD